MRIGADTTIRPAAHMKKRIVAADAQAAVERGCVLELGPEQPYDHGRGQIWKPTATRSAPGSSAFHEAVPCGRRQRDPGATGPARGTIITAKTSELPCEGGVADTTRSARSRRGRRTSRRRTRASFGSGLIFGGVSFQMSEWMSCRSRAPVYPSQSSSGTPAARSHHELASRLSRCLRSRSRPRRAGRRSPPLLGAVGVAEAERPADDQTEREQPEKESVGDAAGEDTRCDASIALDRTKGDGYRDVLLACTLGPRCVRRDPLTGATDESCLFGTGAESPWPRSAVPADRSSCPRPGGRRLRARRQGGVAGGSFH